MTCSRYVYEQIVKNHPNIVSISMNLHLLHTKKWQEHVIKWNFLQVHLNNVWFGIFGTLGCLDNIRPNTDRLIVGLTYTFKLIFSCVAVEAVGESNKARPRRLLSIHDRLLTRVQQFLRVNPGFYNILTGACLPISMATACSVQVKLRAEGTVWPLTLGQWRGVETAVTSCSVSKHGRSFACLQPLPVKVSCPFNPACRG